MHRDNRRQVHNQAGRNFGVGAGAVRSAAKRDEPFWSRCTITGNAGTRQRRRKPSGRQLNSAAQQPVGAHCDVRLVQRTERAACVLSCARTESIGLAPRLPLAPSGAGSATNPDTQRMTYVRFAWRPRQSPRVSVPGLCHTRGRGQAHVPGSRRAAALP